MIDSERGVLGRYRDVSELRIQYLCEHRLYLQNSFGVKLSEASIEGERLHREVGLNPQPVRSFSPLVRALILIATIAAAILWAVG
ncbi:MAG: hypothetical protein ACFFER_00275 [Candidatus Thorarchaeota archaeon]